MQFLAVLHDEHMTVSVFTLWAQMHVDLLHSNIAQSLNVREHTELGRLDIVCLQAAQAMLHCNSSLRDL